MSSALQLVVTEILTVDYLTLTTLTAIGYDYVLTFPSEIEYIWSKPWTRVSTLFVMLRYIGFYNAVVSTVGVCIRTLLLLIFANNQYRLNRCRMLYRLLPWTTVIYVGAAYSLMILHVWTLYDRSKIVLWALLTIYILEIISFTVTCVMLSVPDSLTASTMQILDYSFCVVDIKEPHILSELNTGFGFVLSAGLYILVSAKFIRQSLEMYRTTMRWELSIFVKLLSKDCMLYFSVVLVFGTVNFLYYTSSDLPSSGWRFVLIWFADIAPLYALTPRFILNMRESYARGPRDQVAPCGMDSEFGLRTGYNPSGMAPPAEQNEQEALEEVEEIPMEEKGHEA